MFLWKLKAAADALRSGSVSQWDGVKYLVAASLVQFAQTSISGFVVGTKLDVFGVGGYVLAAVTSAWGLVWLFRINSRGDDRDFVTSYVVLSVPSTIRTVLGYWLLLAVFSVLVAMLRWPPQNSPFWRLFALSVPTLFVTAFLAQLATGIRRAAGSRHHQ